MWHGLSKWPEDTGCCTVEAEEMVDQGLHGTSLVQARLLPQGYEEFCLFYLFT